MTEQARDSMIKPDYEVWFRIYEIIKEEKLTLEQARKWLGQTVIHNVFHIPELVISRL